MKKLILSASSISAYKACPVRFRNAYVYGIRPIEEKKSQRIGTNWHTILEIASLEPGNDCPDCKPNIVVGEQFNSAECPICAGTGKVPDNIMDAVIRVLDKLYANIDFNDPEAKDIERFTLLYALIGYRWYYATPSESVIAREQYFSLPLLNPNTGHPVPNVFIEGRIDKLIKLKTGLAIKEHKTTSKPIDPDSTYWNRLNLDTQTALYIYAARRLQLGNENYLYATGLPKEMCNNGPLINTVKYDVFHKPQIGPKKLTQADSKKFVKTGEYCEQKFTITGIDKIEEMNCVYINGKLAECEPGKKEGAFVIRETSEMFAARFLQDITERPEFYFQCKELTRTDGELKAFEYELYDIAKDMQSKIRANRWWSDEHSCESTFRCDYIEQCYNHETVDPDHIPNGMKCIFEKEESNDTK